MTAISSPGPSSGASRAEDPGDEFGQTGEHNGRVRKHTQYVVPALFPAVVVYRFIATRELDRERFSSTKFYGSIYKHC